MKRRLLVLFGVWGLSAFAVFTIASDAFAAYSSANYWDCINTSNASSVDSVMDACDRASNSPNSPGYGTLWINGSSSVEDSDVIFTDQISGNITIYLHGKQYRISAGSSGAYKIRFCNNHISSSGQLGNCGDKDYLSYSSQYLNRGSTSKSGWRWTTGYNTLAMTLNIDKFIKSPYVNKYQSGSYYVYTDTVEVYRCPTSSASGSDCYSDASYITLYFEKSPEECTGCCPGDPYYENGCVPPDEPDPGEFTDSYDIYEDVYIDDTHTGSASGSSYSSGYYVLPKTTSSTNVGFTKSLSVSDYDADVSGKTSDALSRANDALDYYQNGSGTYSLANGEERRICDGFDYPSYVRYKVHIIEHYDTEPVYGPEGNIIDYVKGAWMYDTIDSITYSSMGSHTDSNVCLNIYRDAEALYGLESSGTAQNSNIVDYLWRTDLAHAAPSGRSFTTSFPTGPTSVSAATGTEGDSLRRTIFLTTKDEDHITLSYSHSISRGLSTTYESYQPNTTTISTPWSTSYTINGVAQSAHARSNNINTTAPTTGLDTVNLGSHTIDVENGDVKFGTYSEAHCETLSHSGIAGITVPIGPTIMSEQPLSTTACLNLFRPWNFELTISTTLDEDDDNHILIADGNSTSASVRVKNHVHLTAEDADYDGRHASRTPEDTKIGIYQFIIGGDVDASIATNSIFGGEVIGGVSDIRSAISSRLTSIPGVSLHQDLTGDTKTISGGILTGKEATHSLSVSKDTDIPAGAKVCVVAAVNYVSSEYINDGRGEGYGVYGSSAEERARNTWLTSNISCRTITSKSLLQIHGGDIMTGGTIDAAAMKIGGTTFNSWADYGIVAIGDVNTADYAGVSSGAFGAFGRDTSGTNTLCDISHIVVANDKCFIDPVSDREIGKSGIYPDTKLIDTIMARFNGTKINGVTIYDVGASTTRHSIGYVNGDGSPVVSDGHVSADPVSGQYYYLRDLERAGDGGHPSTSLDHGTEVIRVTDDAGLIIDQNLTYADGNYLNPFDIPQRIIIVENGNVVITPNVTHLDAWIIVKNGNLITCTEFNAAGNILAREHRSYYGVCDGRLDINGYVVADYIAFERTFFEQPSVLSSTTDRNVIYGNYGERITLPYTSMMWAYNKLHISSISQPSTVYTHTLAPRY